jgi:hypothetical protein
MVVVPVRGDLALNLKLVFMPKDRVLVTVVVPGLVVPMLVAVVVAPLILVMIAAFVLRVLVLVVAIVVTMIALWSRHRKCGHGADGEDRDEARSASCRHSIIPRYPSILAHCDKRLKGRWES